MTEILVPYRIGAERLTWAGSSRATTRCSHDECWSLHGDRYRGRLWCHFGDLKILFAYLLQSTSEGNPGDTVLIRITVWRLLRRVGVEEGNNNFLYTLQIIWYSFSFKKYQRKENAPIHFQMHSHFLFLNINTYYSVHPRQLASYVVVGRSVRKTFHTKGFELSCCITNWSPWSTRTAVVKSLVSLLSICHFHIVCMLLSLNWTNAQPNK